eukprot:g2601.t1
MAESRYFQHSFSDARRDLPVDSFRAGIGKIASKLMHDESRGHSVYTGISGVSFALLRLLTSDVVSFPLQVEQMQLTRRIIWERVLRNVRYSMETMREQSEKRYGWSVLCGHAGVYCVSAIVLNEACKASDLTVEIPSRLNDESHRALRKFINLSVLVNSFTIDQNGTPEDEVLYGRAGYLLGVLLLRHYHLLEDFETLEIVRATLLSGQYQAGLTRHPSGGGLLYHWPPGDNPRPYLGAAHGLMGILYALMHFLTEINALDAIPLIQSGLHFVLSLECDQNGLYGPYGFYPTTSSGIANQPPLVHWCHGSTGAVFLFAKAYEIFQEEVFLNAAVRAGEVVWERGLLKKGPSLCHGVSGNGYALLKLYKVTHDDKYLMRAACFAEFMMSTEFRAARVPDNPWSLFEGWAGALCFLLDILNPHNSQFPFFEF